MSRDHERRADGSGGMPLWLRGGLWVLGALALTVAVIAMRRAFMSTDYDTGEGSATRVVVESRTNRSEPGQTEGEFADAHVSTCRLEIDSDPVGGLEPLHGHPNRFEVWLSPALDSSDRKQYKGCIEDWTIDHHLLDVVKMDNFPPGTGPRRPGGSG